jgi:mannose-1-phosphate guanylyltransferase
MAKENHYGLILAGGRGTRFWPRSRRRHAKQVLNVAGEQTLIQATVARLRDLIPPERIWILTNDFVRDEIVRQLPEVPPIQIIAEPAQRNTAPAIGLAAHILKSIDPKAVFGVFPSDHVIGKPKRYLSMVRAAFKAAERGAMVVLGVEPRWPEIGYGYIEFPAGTIAGTLEMNPVKRFQEKPVLSLAKRYIKAGNFYWNAGMFFWRTDTLLNALQEYLPDMAQLLSGLPAFQHPDFAARMAELFPQCQDISIDYGVMQKAKNRVGIACGDFGWNDVGSWDAVYDLLPKDADLNAARSGILAIESTGNYVDGGKKLIVLLGVKDLVIVDTPDALLVTDRKHAQQVGDVVRWLEKNGREDLI